MFRTVLEKLKGQPEIDFRNSFLCLGSCFSDNIGLKLSNDKFECFVNQPGTLFHPSSINQLISLCLKNEQPHEDKFLERDDLWFHYDFHSSRRAHSKNDLSKLLADLIRKSRSQLKTCDYLVITWGTSWIFRHLATDSFVANCHKVPASQFSRELISAKTIIENTETTLTALRNVNPDLKVILTVSPVRHIRDGLVQNNVSKSNLLIAAYHLTQNYDNLFYYPAYEIMMDDLRDYRFYEKDLIHPNSMAIDYIYDHFKNSYFNKETREILKQWNKLQQMLNHRPFNEKSTAHQKFLKNLYQDLTRLSSQLPLEAELKDVQKRIDAI